jgi:hypothetical protein
MLGGMSDVTQILAAAEAGVRHGTEQAPGGGGDTELFGGRW